MRHNSGLRGWEILTRGSGLTVGLAILVTIALKIRFLGKINDGS